MGLKQRAPRARNATDPATIRSQSSAQLARSALMAPRSPTVTQAATRPRAPRPVPSAQPASTALTRPTSPSIAPMAPTPPRPARRVALSAPQDQLVPTKTSLLRLAQPGTTPSTPALWPAPAAQLAPPAMGPTSRRPAPTASTRQTA